MIDLASVFLRVVVGIPVLSSLKEAPRFVEVDFSEKLIAVINGFSGSLVDFICFQKIIVEIKAVSRLTDVHRAQLLNYLKATHMKLGILVNFSSYPKLEYQRIVTPQKIRAISVIRG